MYSHFLYDGPLYMKKGPYDQCTAWSYSHILILFIAPISGEYWFLQTQRFMKWRLSCTIVGNSTDQCSVVKRKMTVHQQTMGTVLACAAISRRLAPRHPSSCQGLVCAIYFRAFSPILFRIIFRGTGSNLVQITGYLQSVQADGGMAPWSRTGWPVSKSFKTIFTS
jgi:hypothetical protein